MKKTKKIKQQLTQQQPTQEQPKEEFQELSQEQQDMSLFFRLSDTEYWGAICRYVDTAVRLCYNSFGTFDPYKYPAEISRNQGSISALQGLIRYVEEIKEQQMKKL